MKNKRVIYSTSFLVDDEIEAQWVEYMKLHYIGYILYHGLCSDVIFTKVLFEQPEGKNYSLQIIFDSEELLNRFTNRHLHVLEQMITESHGNKCLRFTTTLLEI